LDRSSIIATEEYLMIDDDTKANLPVRTERGTFAPGVSGHPAGRGNSPGAFSKALLRSVSAKWREHGDDVLNEVRRDDPGLFLRVCASLIPKELLVVTHSTTPLRQMTSMELQAVVIADATTAEKMRQRLEPLIEELAKKDLPLAKQMWAAMKVDEDVED
jgi:hypothetical protein